MGASSHWTDAIRNKEMLKCVSCSLTFIRSSDSRVSFREGFLLSFNVNSRYDLKGKTLNVLTGNKLYLTVLPACSGIEGSSYSH